LNSDPCTIEANIKKEIIVKPVIPDDIEVLPWAGHLGIRLLERVVDLIHHSRSTLIFTNTRSQTEIWYQHILNHDPGLAGQIAVHHGSLSSETRTWVEQAIHDEKLKAVVCTSSLDLGVDFRPVETIIQIGSAKGVSRFMQRAGRSGHSPGETSTIYFVPTHSLELVESAAFREAVGESFVENRVPYILSFDVLAQYLITLAISSGFYENKIFNEIKKTYSFSEMNEEEWKWVLNFITKGGASLQNYDDYSKVIIEDGKFKVKDRKTALKHRLSIGTIVGDTLMKIKYLKGTYIGNIEEWFISKLNPGDIFWFSGKSLELVRIKDMVVQVKRSKENKGKVPQWMGGRMPLSTNMSEMIRKKLTEVKEGTFSPGKDPELKALDQLFNLQNELSILPSEDQFLIEYYRTREGYHLIMYPFEGRYVHEGMASIIAYRMSKNDPATFSIAMNDYGFELLSHREFNLELLKDPDLFSIPCLTSDIHASINFTEMARRRFRDIAVISGLVFRGYPGDRKPDKHLQASSQLLYEVFREYDPENLLLRQAFNEVLDFQLEELRMRRAFERINGQEIIICYPVKITPFAFPLMVDRLREQMSLEKLQKRIERMKVMAVNK
jgi:ATP-dependent Lhr-like helicase